MRLRLGFHYHVPACLKDGQLYTPGYQGCFIDSLAAHCEQLVCFLHSPMPAEMQHMDYAIQAPQVSWVDLGAHGSLPQRWRQMPHTYRTIYAWQTRLDLLLIRAPTPLLATIAGAAGPLPTVLLLVGDYVSSLHQLKQPAWRKTLIRGWVYWNKYQQTQLARRSLTFVNSHRLYQELQGSVPNLVETFTTTLNETDVFERPDTCLAPPYHLLYTGRIERAKGLLTMVEAVDGLVKQGEDVILDLVGWPAAQDNFLDEMQQLVDQRGLRARVIYHGYSPLGPALFNFYRQADIYVLASTFEGFPRTIWEAMAHSLPIVATRVGSIPDFAEGVVELVPPEQPEALARGIQRVLQDAALRKARIASGLQLVRDKTLQAQSQRMLAAIHAWLPEAAEKAKKRSSRY